MGPSDQPEAYFNGSSYLRLQTTISLKRQTGFSFKTCTGIHLKKILIFLCLKSFSLLGGDLFSQQHNDNLIELSVDSDGITFIVKTMRKQFKQEIKGNFVDNEWHTVFIQYRLGNLTLDIDGEITVLY